MSPSNLSTYGLENYLSPDIKTVAVILFAVSQVLLCIVLILFLMRKLFGFAKSIKKETPFLLLFYSIRLMVLSIVTMIFFDLAMPTEVRVVLFVLAACLFFYSKYFISIVLKKEKVEQ